MSTGEMCGLQTGPGEYCDDERMPFERRCAFHALAEARTQLSDRDARIAELEEELTKAWRASQSEQSVIWNEPDY